jgi:hypothetical protein
MSQLPPTTTRDAAYEFAMKWIPQSEAENRFNKIFGANVGPMPGEHLTTPSFASPAAHAPLLALGYRFVGSEQGDNVPDSPMRYAFNRGAVRQYGVPWGTHLSAFGYESGPPHDTEVSVGNWLTSRKGDIYGTSIALMRHHAYLSWLSGQSAHHFEDISIIFWRHWHTAEKRSLTPRGLAINEFLETTRKFDRGTPVTPIAFLMDERHGWTNNALVPYRIHDNLPPAEADFATDQHFESLSWPLRRDMSNILRDEQVMMPQSIIGDTYDVIITADAGIHALNHYRVVWLVGDTRLRSNWVAALKKFVEAGGTLVANVEQARGVLGEDLLGAKLTGQRATASMAKCALEGEPLDSTSFDYEKVTLVTAEPIVTTHTNDPVVTQNAIGKGQVILTTPRWMMSRDGWALPLQPHLLLHVNSGLLPVEVRGNVGYTINRNDKGWLVGLMNRRGVHKHPHGQAVVDPTEDAAVEVYFNGRPHTSTTLTAGDIQIIQIDQ